MQRVGKKHKHVKIYIIKPANIFNSNKGGNCMQRLVGMKFKHDIFGEGVAGACNGDHLTVQFQNVSATFVVPDAFYGGLAAKDPEDWAVIIEAIEDWERASSPEQLKRPENYCLKKRAARKKREELRLKRRSSAGMSV